MAILDAYGVKGTFFEVGKAIDAEPQITRALYDDGQLLGNHSYHHDQWRWLDPRYPELQRTQDAFRRAIGTCPVLYRPPHGDRTPFLASVVRDHHMHMVLWSASAGDWATNDAQLVARRILAGARPGAILLLHDGLDGNPAADRQVLVRALPLILNGLRAKGLSAVRLDRLLGTARVPELLRSTRRADAKEPPARCTGGSREVTRRQMTRTFCASWPLRPCATSNSTRWPSSRVLYPSPWIAEK